MSLAPDVIFSEAMKLPQSERLTLVSRLMETMPDDDGGLSLDDPSLIEELDRRSGDLSGSEPWSELHTE